MKIGFATSDWSQTIRDGRGYPAFGGAGWARVGLPARCLAENGGHDVVAGLLVTGFTRGGGAVLGVHDWSGEHHYDCDVIVLQRIMADTLPDEIAMARAAGQTVIQDVDDWFWGVSSKNLAWLANNPNRSPNWNVTHYQRSLTASTLITVSTPFLARKLERLTGRPTVVLRNMIDVDLFDVREQAERPTIGWAGAIPWRSGDIEILRGIIGPFLEKHDLRFHHAGHMDFSQIVGVGYQDFGTLAKIAPERMSTSPMVPTDDLRFLYSEFDVGVVPLSDIPFNHAKSSIKGLEMGVSGIPPIASATPEYELLAEQGGCVVARRPRDWIRELERMLDLEEREIAAKRARENVLARWAADVRWREWEAVYMAALGG